MNVRLVSFTKPVVSFDQNEISVEHLMAYCARVSSPNQENISYERLLSYCIAHKHWSIFEMADMTVEITTSRAISSQILRHRSFSFQEFSQRYAEPNAIEIYMARSQDKKNRQNSFDDINPDDQEWFRDAQEQVKDVAFTYYKEAITRGIAKESARILLPLSTQTKLYMKGSVRSWIHYIELRTDSSTQKEHREIAEEVKKIFISVFPNVGLALKWKKEGTNV